MNIIYFVGKDIFMKYYMFRDFKFMIFQISKKETFSVRLKT